MVDYLFLITALQDMGNNYSSHALKPVSYDPTYCCSAEAITEYQNASRGPLSYKQPPSSRNPILYICPHDLSTNNNILIINALFTIGLKLSK